MTNLASDTVTFNLEHFRKKLSDEIDEKKRVTLLRLIAEETAKLSAMSPATAPSRSRRTMSALPPEADIAKHCLDVR